jgi:hypothetical protein
MRAGIIVFGDSVTGKEFSEAYTRACVTVPDDPGNIIMPFAW